MISQEVPFASAGSQRWLQVAINNAPHLLFDTFQPHLQLSSSDFITWRSPLAEDNFKEYRDATALRKLGIQFLPKKPLSEFWPQRGPVWDGLGITSDGRYIFVEAKAHINEVASPGTRATPASLALIQQSLREAREYYAPHSQAAWDGLYYQYANRLAHQYLFHAVNGLQSHMIFLYFMNASEMNGPKTEHEWTRAIKILHSALGLHDLEDKGVHNIFMDVSPLLKFAQIRSGLI